LAGALFDMMTKLSFDPVVFPPGTADQGSSREKIAATGKVLQERPQLRLRLCGWAAPADLKVLQQADLEKWQLAQPKTEKPPKDGKLPTPAAYLTETEAGLGHYRQALLDLARKRSEILLETLVNQYQVGVGRLFLCDPTIDQEAEAPPRVEISL